MEGATEQRVETGERCVERWLSVSGHSTMLLLLIDSPLIADIFS